MRKYEQIATQTTYKRYQCRAGLTEGEKHIYQNTARDKKIASQCRYIVMSISLTPVKLP